jgi:hypothetical protein
VVLDKAARDFARRVIASQLSKFSRRIQRIVLHIDDVSGPKGAPVVSCRAVIHVARMEPITVESESPDTISSIARTIERCERSLRRTVERRETRRTRP